MEIASRIASGPFKHKHNAERLSSARSFTLVSLRTSCRVQRHLRSAIRYRFGAHGTEACPMTHASMILPPITCSCPTRLGTSW